MTRSDLGNPRPREQPRGFMESGFAVAGYRYLDVPAQQTPINIWSVIETRATRHGLATLDMNSLSAFLWFTAKTRSSQTDASGTCCHHRPAPSAGGRHPIDILIVEHPPTPSLAVYDPAAHALCDLRPTNTEALREVVDEINAITMNEHGAVLLFAANFDRTTAKYEHGESLVWRDSGALMTMCYLVAEGLGLGCCGIGVTGEPFVSSLPNNAPNVCGVGGCIVGARRSS